MAFTGHAQLFARLCLFARNQNVCEWSEDTLREAMRWGAFLEELRDAMQPSDVALAQVERKKKKKRKKKTLFSRSQRYLDSPSSFVSTGQEDENAVVAAGLSCKILFAASHFLLRNLLKNDRLAENLVLFKVSWVVVESLCSFLRKAKGVLMTWMGMVNDASERPDAAASLVKDLEKEVSHQHLLSKFIGEWMQVHAPAIFFDEVNLSPSCVFDQELRLFVLRPNGARFFGLSRALIPKLDGLAACERSVSMCRKRRELLEVLLLTTVPPPICFGAKQAQRALAPRMVETLVSVVLKHQHALNLWSDVDPFLLMKVAAESQTFAIEFRKAQ